MYNENNFEVEVVYMIQPIDVVNLMKQFERDFKETKGSTNTWPKFKAISCRGQNDDIRAYVAIIEK